MKKVAVKVDKRFHYAVARAAKNGLILAILNAVSSLIDDFMKDQQG